jgi:hypothetical protein
VEPTRSRLVKPPVGGRGASNVREEGLDPDTEPRLGNPKQPVHGPRPPTMADSGSAS